MLVNTQAIEYVHLSNHQFKANLMKKLWSNTDIKERHIRKVNSKIMQIEENYKALGLQLNGKVESREGYLIEILSNPGDTEVGNMLVVLNRFEKLLLTKDILENIRQE